MKIKSFLTAVALLGLGMSAQAIPLTFTFEENGAGTLGASSIFTEGGYSITATGIGDTLYAKNAGGTETGLGLTHDSDHEISGQNWIQLDVSQLIGSTLSFVFLSSVQNTEAGKVYFSNAAGVLGTLITTVANADGSVNITSYLSNKYINVAAGSGNVLIASLSASVPDGGTTITMLGGALTVLGLIRRKLVR